MPKHLLFKQKQHQLLIVKQKNNRINNVLKLEKNNYVEMSI